MTEQFDTLPLRDIHLPDPISWWPPAPGWWLLLGLLLVLVALSFLFSHLWRRGRLRREARAVLEQIQNRYAQQGDGQQLAVDLSVLLRRIAISRYPQAEVAGLTDAEWLGFLDQGIAQSKVSNGFSQGVGRVLVEAPYRPDMKIDAEDLLLLCQSWVQALPPGNKRP